MQKIKRVFRKRRDAPSTESRQDPEEGMMAIASDLEQTTLSDPEPSKLESPDAPFSAHPAVSAPVHAEHPTAHPLHKPLPSPPTPSTPVLADTPTAEEVVAKANTHSTDTTVETHTAPGKTMLEDPIGVMTIASSLAPLSRPLLTRIAVIHETIIPVVHEIRQEQITREIHNHDIHHRIQPIIDREILPAKHYMQDERGEVIPVAAEDVPAEAEVVASWETSTWEAQTGTLKPYSVERETVITSTAPIAIRKYPQVGKFAKHVPNSFERERSETPARSSPRPYEYDPNLYGSTPPQQLYGSTPPKARFLAAEEDSPRSRERKQRPSPVRTGSMKSLRSKSSMRSIRSKASSGHVREHSER